MKFAAGAKVEFVGSLAATVATCGGDDDSGGDPSGGAGGSSTAGSGGSGPAGSAGGGGSGGLNGAGGLASARGLTCDTPLVACAGACVDLRSQPDRFRRARMSSTRRDQRLRVVPPQHARRVRRVRSVRSVDDGTPSRRGLAHAKGRLAARNAPRAQGLADDAGEDAFAGTAVRTRAMALAAGKPYRGPLGPDATTLVSGSPGAAAPDAAPFAIEQANLRHLTTAAGRLFWTIGKAPPQLPTGSVRSKALSGGSALLESDNEPAPEWIDANAEGRPYWIDVETNEVHHRSAVPPGSVVLFSGGPKLSLQITPERVSWAIPGGALFSYPTDDPGSFRLDHEGPYNRLGGFRADGTTTYFVTFETGAFSVWRLAEGADAPLLLRRVAAKAAGYAGNPFGATQVLADESYVYFTDPRTVDTGQGVAESEVDEVVYRVAR